MNPLLLKFGIPAAVLGLLAFMHWSNAKAMGQPVFPGVGDDSSKKGSGGGAGLSIGRSGEPELTSPDEVTSGDYFDEASYDDSSTEDTTDPLATDPNIGASSKLSGVTATHPGANVGGYNVGSPAQQQAVSAAIQSPYTGGYVPYSPTPTTQPVSNQFGGQGGGGTFAI